MECLTSCGRQPFQAILGLVIWVTMSRGWRFSEPRGSWALAKEFQAVWARRFAFQASSHTGGGCASPVTRSGILIADYFRPTPKKQSGPTLALHADKQQIEIWLPKTCANKKPTIRVEIQPIVLSGFIAHQLHTTLFASSEQKSTCYSKQAGMPRSFILWKPRSSLAGQA